MADTSFLNWPFFEQRHQELASELDAWAARSLADDALPLGLAHGCRLRRDVACGETLRWADVDLDGGDATVRLRRELERDGARERLERHLGGRHRRIALPGHLVAFAGEAEDARVTCEEASGVQLLHPAGVMTLT